MPLINRMGWILVASIFIGFVVGMDVNAATREPVWRVLRGPDDEKVFFIVVNTSRLAHNEVLSSAVCRVVYYDKNGASLGEKTHQIDVPVEQGVTKRQRFAFAVDNASRVKGLQMEWKVIVYGAMADNKKDKTQKAVTKRRSGSTPPSDEDP